MYLLQCVRHVHYEQAAAAVYRRYVLHGISEIKNKLILLRIRILGTASYRKLFALSRKLDFFATADDICFGLCFVPCAHPVHADILSTQIVEGEGGGG